VIPADINRKNRAEMDDALKKMGVRIFSNIHVSGHSSREDIRDMISMLKPKHLIPTHGETDRVDSFIALAEEMGYSHEKIHGLVIGQSIKIV
jgi:ribonuclease J